MAGDAERVEEILLAVDVVVEAPPEDADAGRDVLDPGGLVPLLVEELAGGVEDLGPSLRIHAALRDRAAGWPLRILLHDHSLTAFRRPIAADAKR